MAKCPICATALPDDHPGLVAETLLADAPWGILESRYSASEGSEIEACGFTLKVVKRNIETTYDSYGDPQEGEGFIVLEVNGQYYRRDCTIDSYGDIEWRGGVRLVTAQPKVITEYDYV